MSSLPARQAFSVEGQSQADCGSMRSWSLRQVDGGAVTDTRKRARAAYFKKYNAENGSRSGKRKAPPPEKRIIAIDGEGYTLADGSHRYTYFAACDEEGLVRELRTPKGVTAGQVFEFLLKLPKKALLVGFALGGHVGVGTVVFALLIGPSVEASFFLVDRFGLAAVPVPAPAGEASS